MENIIKEWLQYEPRRVRPPEHSIYPLTVELIMSRMKIMLPPSLIRNKKILDLGCGIPFNELWCRSHGAKLFHGVEILKKLADIGNSLIDRPNFIFNDSIENFVMQANLQEYDIIITQSSLNAVEHFQNVITKIFQSKATIIFEMNNCLSTEDPVIYYTTEGAQATDEINKIWKVQKCFPNLKAMEHFCSISKYKLNSQPNKIMQLKLKEWSKYKWCGWASPDSQKKEFPLMKDHVWKFNSKVARIFDGHAPKHIPDYDFIIDSIPSIINNKVKHNEKILEVGCATGKTLKKLFYYGYHNLEATEVSKDMLDICPTSLAKYYNINYIPEGKYKCIIANWTLHFNKNKEKFLQDIIDALDTKATLIITEKTSAVDRQIYNTWKMQQGLSEQEVHEKEESLKSIMFLNDKDWYENIFKRNKLKYKVFNNKFGFITWIVEN
jgi:SAM-dependent methyltransferase